MPPAPTPAGHWAQKDHEVQGVNAPKIHVHLLPPSDAPHEAGPLSLTRAVAPKDGHLASQAKVSVAPIVPAGSDAGKKSPSA